MEHTLSVLVENKFGVLARVAGLFSARGFNITSLAVGETQDPTISQMTIVVNAPDDRILEQIAKQLHKLIDTISVVDLTKKDFVERELALIKINYEKSIQKKVNDLIEKNKDEARLLRNKKNEAIVELCASSKEVKNLIEDFRAFGIRELMRTGRVAIA